MNFHEQKMWQEAYVALMKIHEKLDNINVNDQDESVIGNLVESAEAVAATIADSLTRQDHRIARDLIQSAVGQIAKTRTHLAVSWGRGIMDDETFTSLDDTYAHLTTSLQSSH